MYQLKLDASLVYKYSGYRALVIYASDLANSLDANSEALTYLRGCEENFRKTYSKDDLMNHPHILAWRAAYRKFGTRPREAVCSVEALGRRVLSGKPLPSINPLVNMYNAVSLQYMTPIGGEDWDQLASDLVLREAQGHEVFTQEIGGQQVITSPDSGEIIWEDVKGVTCRKWNWRQSHRTQLTEGTHNAYFVIDYLPEYGDKDCLYQASETLIAQIKLCSVGATYFADELALT